jgi:hypothetical protein
MIDYHRFCQIKHLHDHQGLNASQIAHEVALNRRTVAYWLAQDHFRPRKPRPSTSKLAPFKPEIVRLLERHPYSAAQVLQRLREHGFAGSYELVKTYVRTVRPTAPPRVPHPGLCPGRVCPGRLGLIWYSPGRANAPAAEFLCHGVVLQSHAVCRVHRLPDDGTLSRLPPTCL